MEDIEFIIRFKRTAFDYEFDPLTGKGRDLYCLEVAEVAGGTKTQQDQISLALDQMMMVDSDGTTQIEYGPWI